MHKRRADPWSLARASKRRKGVDGKSESKLGDNKSDEEHKVAANVDGKYWSYYAGAYAKHAAMFGLLRPFCATTKKKVRMFGEEFLEPRLSTYFSLDGHQYRYSGLTHLSQGWPNALQTLMFRTFEITGECYDAALMNLYANGKDYISAHADKDAIPNLPVASWSFGQSRSFVLRHKEDNIVALKQELQSGSLFIMEKGCQERFVHELPKRSPNKCPNERINVTLRQHSKDVCDLMPHLFRIFGDQPFITVVTQLLFWRPHALRE